MLKYNIYFACYHFWVCEQIFKVLDNIGLKVEFKLELTKLILINLFLLYNDYYNIQNVYKMEKKR